MEQERDELKLRKIWIARARDKAMTMETLPAFLKELAEHPHDYGTICVAMAAGAIATCYALDRTPNGGITGFQAGCVGWDFLRGWHSWPEDGAGHALLDYDLLLYPQYARQFNSVSRKVLDRVREKARKMLREKGQMCETVRAHMVFVAEGGVPFGLAVSDD